LFGQLDTRAIESQYSPEGQHAYHPKKMVSILIYGYTHGVFSMRELEKRCYEDLSFMYIARMSCPNFRTLNNFRKDNAAFFEDCFKQSVELAMELKMASLGHVSFDGSKFKANSSNHKAMSYGRLKEKESKLCKEIEDLIKQGDDCNDEEDREYQDKSSYELPDELAFKERRLETIQNAKKALEAREESINPGQEIDDKKQISFADHEARIMGKNGSFAYSYNPQISVDGDFQIIVGQHVSQNANDKKEVEAGLESIQNAAGKYPVMISLDNGYFSAENLKALERSEVDTYIATDRDDKKHSDSLTESERKLVKSDFCYDEKEDCFHCPKDHALKLKNKGTGGKQVYQGDIAVCASCPLFSRCSQSKKGEARTITTDKHEGLRQAMRIKMEQKEAKEIYKRRKVIVEPVFGQIKNGGFRGFSLRGKEKVAGEFSLVCAGHNIKKMVKAIMTGAVCSAFG
jgi:transposase